MYRTGQAKPMELEILDQFCFVPLIEDGRSIVSICLNADGEVKRGQCLQLFKTHATKSSRQHTWAA